jgi:methylase of polypeptide subunit release factors
VRALTLDLSASSRALAGPPPRAPFRRARFCRKLTRVPADAPHQPLPGTPGRSGAPGKSQSWTVGELLRWTTDRFTKAGIDDARVDAEHLLAMALGCKRLELYVQHARLLDEATRAPFRDFVRRRLSREPVAYIRGTRGFHALDLDLAVDRRVLIPRPETEHLVDWLLEELPRAPQPEQFEDPPSGAELDAAISERVEAEAAAARTGGDEESSGDAKSGGSEDGESGESGESGENAESAENGESRATDDEPIYVVDVGTGSGAIALAIKRARPDVNVLAIERSEEALAVAAANIEKCGLDVHLRRGDLLNDTRPPRGGFHAVAANLPYIPSADLAGLQPEVRDFEPMSALDGGPDGLDLVRRLIDRCAQPGVLAPGGRIYLEIGIHQAPAVIAELERRGFVDVAARKDYGGIERVIAATAPLR